MEILYLIKLFEERFKANASNKPISGNHGKKISNERTGTTEENSEKHHVGSRTIKDTQMMVMLIMMMMMIFYGVNKRNDKSLKIFIIIPNQSKKLTKERNFIY